MMSLPLLEPFPKHWGEERKWVHYGLTSTDVVDTANSYLIKQANKILLGDLENFLAVLKKKALEHKATVMMGGAPTASMRSPPLLA